MLISTKSPSAPAMSSSCKTLSSSAICSFISGGSCAQPDAAINARWRGWRTFTPDSARAARPSSTIRRVCATCAESARSIAEFCAMGKSARCTEAGACGSTGQISSCHTCSEIKGTMGASKSVSVRNDSCNVASALGSPSQKRRRERRTYQLDKSSINVARALPAL